RGFRPVDRDRLSDNTSRLTDVLDTATRLLYAATRLALCDRLAQLKAALGGRTARFRHEPRRGRMLHRGTRDLQARLAFCAVAENCHLYLAFLPANLRSTSMR